MQKLPWITGRCGGHIPPTNYLVINMNLLKCMGLDPKEQEITEAKIGLELAISGRLEHRVCSMIDERLKHEEMDEEVIQLIKEINEQLRDCGDEFFYTMDVEEDFHCIKFDKNHQLLISDLNDEQLEDELTELKVVIERWREEFWDVEIDFNAQHRAMFGDCEALFYDVCPALDGGRVCENCKCISELEENAEKRGIELNYLPKDQATMDAWL